MDTQKKTFHCKTTTEQELTGKKILQNCRNQLYLDFPYLDGAFASLEYKADSSIDTIGTDGELIYFNPVFLMKKYLEDPAAVRRGTCCFTVCTFIFSWNLTEIPVNGTGNATVL